MTTHEQPLYTQPYSEMADGVEIRGERFYKTVEVRAYDPKYDGIEKGDTLLLNEFDPKIKQFTGRKLSAEVSYVKRFLPGDGDYESRFRNTVSKMVKEIGLKPICPGCKSDEDLVQLLGKIPTYPERIADKGVLAIGLEDITVLK